MTEGGARRPLQGIDGEKSSGSDTTKAKRQRHRHGPEPSNECPSRAMYEASAGVTCKSRVLANTDLT